MIEDVNEHLIQECEMFIIGHKIFVRLKDIPMYLSKKTKDSIRNRYSHSIEVGMATEYILSSVSKELGSDVDVNFFKIAKIVGLVHDIGHTAFSHDGEVILDKMLQKASASLPRKIRFNANLNNFRRISKYGLFDLLPNEIKKYAFASLIKRKKDLKEYPEYLHMQDSLTYAIKLEERYLASKEIIVSNVTKKTILCQAMDLADENRYRVTDIIDSLNIFSKQKLIEILIRSISSQAQIKDIKKLVSLNYIENENSIHFNDKTKIKELLIFLLNQESNAKTEFQNVMNSISMAFNRNFCLSKDGRLMPIDKEIEKLREDFHNIAAKYLWGSKKIKKIKAPFKHYFTFVADYFINQDFDINMIDSSTYKKTLIQLKEKNLDDTAYHQERLSLMRNFLGGLTNLKIIELYKKIKISKFQSTIVYGIDKKANNLAKNNIKIFQKKLETMIAI